MGMTGPELIAEMSRRQGDLVEILERYGAVIGRIDRRTERLAHARWAAYVALAVSIATACYVGWWQARGPGCKLDAPTCAAP